MKIGIDIRPLIDKNYSGVSWYTLYLVRSILALDKKNEYKLFYNSFKNLERRLPDFGSDVKITRYFFPNRLLNFCFKFFNWPKIDKYLNCDILLMPNINFISASKKCRIVLTIHDLSFIRKKEFFNLKMRLWHRFVGVRQLAKKSHTIVSVSDGTKKDLIELLDIKEEKIKVIYSGLDDRFRKINKNFYVSDYGNMSEREKNDIKALARAKGKYNLPDRFFFYLGTLEPRKNVSGIIQAYNIFRANNNSDYKLVLAGARGWKSKNIFAYWRKSKFKNDIIFLDYVDDCDKVYLYNLASLFIFPSFYEGFGFPPLESLLCGTPVISSFAPSLNEVLGDQVILVDPYNENDLAAAMKEAIDFKKEINILRIKEEFNWKKAAEKYIDIFNS